MEVVDNGVDVAHFAAVDRTHAEPHRLLFLGSLDWRPNLDAVGLLLDAVFPAVRRRIPDATLALVGRKPPDWLRRRAAEAAGVELFADVPDVRPHLAAAAALVVPLRAGGGSRLKILEALAAGVPVVSTAVGAEGLSDGVHRVIDLAADAGESFVAAACARLARPPHLDRAAVGRELRRYEWDDLADELAAAWERTAA